MKEIFIMDGDAAAFMFKQYQNSSNAFLSLSMSDGELWVEADENGKITVVFIGTFANNDEWENLTGRIDFKLGVVSMDKDNMYEAVYYYDRIIDMSSNLELI